MLRFLVCFEHLLQGEGTYQKMLVIKTSPLVVVIGGIKVTMVGKAISASRSRLYQTKDSHIY